MDSDRMNSHDSRDRVAAWFLAVLLFGGAAVRLFGCWAFRHNLNVDAGVVALMAKHIAEGASMPVFFYGQPHMGSLEPLFSGLFYRFLSPTGFSVCLGTAFVSLWLLPIAYVWTRRAAGAWAGCAAVGLLVIGPHGFFHYNASPRGGYASALTLGPLTLWLATRMAIRNAEGKPPRGLDFFLLGIGAGLAWWSNLITAASILASGSLLLLYLKRAAWTWRLAPGLAGFLIGSAPFWLYNVTRGWPSLVFSGSIGRVPWTQALYWFVAERLPSLILPANVHWSVRAAVAAVYLVACGVCLYVLVFNRRECPIRLRVTLSGIALFFVLFAALYASSHFAAIPTPRYSLPMVAPLAVAVGCALSRLSRRLLLSVGMGVVALMMVVQAPLLMWARDFERNAAQRMQALQKVAGELRAIGSPTFYTTLLRRYWNFALREEFVFADFVGEAYAPYARRAEEEAGIAVLDDHGGVEAFLAAAGGGARRSAAAGHTVHDRFAPPKSVWTPIANETVRSIADAEGAECRGLLLGSRLDTEWRSPAKPGARWLDIEFDRPVDFAGLRLYLTETRFFRATWRIRTPTEAGTWIDLVAPAPISRFFWSGNRPYWGAPFFRLEYRSAEPRRLTRLRIEDCGEAEGNGWAIRRLVLFEVSAEERPAYPDTAALLAALDERGIRFLYCDRGPAHRIAEASEGRILTSRPSGFGPDSDMMSERGVSVAPETGFLVHIDEAQDSRAALEARQLVMNELDLGAWRLFYTEPGRRRFTPRIVPGLVWSGIGFGLDEAIWADELYRQARERLRSAPNDPEVAALLRQAVDRHPQLYDAWSLLADVAPSPEVMAARQALDPALPGEIVFSNGVRFRGIALDSNDWAPGQTVTMRYYWQLPSHIDPNDWAAFVHFKRGRSILFQDDRVLLDTLPRAFLRVRPESGFFVEERRWLTPTNVDDGPLDMAIGLLDRRSNRRVRASSALPVRKNATLWRDLATVRRCN